MGNDQAFAELGVPSDASEAEIKAAWRRLASRWHPDRNASAQAVARMQRINQAFEAIQRARQAGADAPEPSPPPPPPPAPPPAAATQAEPAPEQPERPAHPPIRRKLKLTLEEAAAGCIKTVRGKFTPVCGQCAGQGHHLPGLRCRRCRGSGTVVRPSAWFGWPGQEQECADCAGSGVTRDSCQACAGSGQLPEQPYEVQVRLPAGVRDGDLLHVASRRAPADLEVQVGVAQHPIFVLQGDGSLHCRVPVDGFAWMANRGVNIPTLEGVQRLALDRDQQVYRLPGLGFPTRHRGPRAELVVLVQPLFPAKLSTDQEILLDQLIASSSGADARLADWQAMLRTRERKRPRS